MADTRYWGLFRYGPSEARRVKIAVKRYDEELHLGFMMKTVIDQRQDGGYFRPARREINDYKCNLIAKDMDEIRRDWENDTKPMIDRVLAETKGHIFSIGEDDLAMSGILEPDEASTNAEMKTMLSATFAAEKRAKLYYSLYAQFFHQMASKIEALTVKVLTLGGYEGDRFNRNVLYAFKGSKEGTVKGLSCFHDYDKLYGIWNFIKHNSKSTFDYLLQNFPDVLLIKEYTQGDIACYYVDFTDALINGILRGTKAFLVAYCGLVFGEDVEEASWNSDEYFLREVNTAIEGAVNPLGLPSGI
jgi:hypothetical protein